MLGRMGSLSNHLMRGKRPPKGTGMRGRTKAVGRMMDTKAFGCTDNPQSVPTLWVERPGQDLNLRGVTHRFSRPAPYRTRRPAAIHPETEDSDKSSGDRSGDRSCERTLKSRIVLDGLMHVTAEILPGRREESIELGPAAKGLDLLRALRLAPDAHILMRGDGPIPVDEVLSDGERIRVIVVVSGGVAG